MVIKKRVVEWVKEHAEMVWKYGENELGKVLGAASLMWETVIKDENNQMDYIYNIYY